MILKTHRRTIYCIAIAYLLAGCAGPTVSKYAEKAYQWNPKLSYANNVMHAAGLIRISDTKISAEDFAEIIQTVGHVPSTRKSFLGAGIGAVSHGLSNPTGIGGAASAGLFLLHALTKQTYYEEETSQFLAWYPSENTDDSSNLLEKVQLEFQNSLKRFLDKRKLSYELINESLDQYFYEVGYWIDVDRNIDCGGSRNHIRKCKVTLAFRIKKSIIDSPSFTGATESKIPEFIGIENGHFIKGTIVSTFSSSSSFNTGVIFQEVSADLGSNVFFYLAPKRYTFEDETKKVHQGQIPLLINDGKIHYFIVKE